MVNAYEEWCDHVADAILAAFGERTEPSDEAVARELATNELAGEAWSDGATYERCLSIVRAVNAARARAREWSRG